MTDPNMRIVLTTGETFVVPLSKYHPLANGIVRINKDDGEYTIFPIGIAYTVKEKAVAEKKSKAKKA